MSFLQQIAARARGTERVVRLRTPSPFEDPAGLGPVPLPTARTAPREDRRTGAGSLDAGALDGAPGRPDAGGLDVDPVAVSEPAGARSLPTEAPRGGVQAVASPAGAPPAVVSAAVPSWTGSRADARAGAGDGARAAPPSGEAGPRAPVGPVGHPVADPPRAAPTDREASHSSVPVQRRSDAVAPGLAQVRTHVPDRVDDVAPVRRTPAASPGPAVRRPPVAGPPLIDLVRSHVMPVLVAQGVVGPDERLEVRPAEAAPVRGNPVPPRDARATAISTTPAGTGTVDGAVHVHIDRVDVVRTATPAPAPPATRARRVDHDGYLAERRRRDGR